MEVEELRLGNLVWQNYTDMVEEVDQRVTMISADRIHLEEVSVEPKWIQPIKLTEEWLLRMGFEKQGPIFEDMNNPYWVKNGVVLFFNESQPEYKWKIGFAEMRNGKYYATASRWIDKIHEVQNAYYAFLGTELTIKP